MLIEATKLIFVFILIKNKTKKPPPTNKKTPKQHKNNDTHPKKKERGKVVALSVQLVLGFLWVVSVDDLVRYP